MPTVLEYTSYVFYCNACALGVFFEFSDFKRFIEETHEYKNVPNPILPTLEYILYGLTCISIYTVGTIYFPHARCFTDEYDAYPYYYRLVYFYMSFFLRRFFYHTAFHMTTAANRSCGLGYNGTEKGPDGKVIHKWDKVIGVFTIACETTTSLQ